MYIYKCSVYGVSLVRFASTREQSSVFRLMCEFNSGFFLSRKQFNLTVFYSTIQLKTSFSTFNLTCSDTIKKNKNNNHMNDSYKLQLERRRRKKNQQITTFYIIFKITYNSYTNRDKKKHFMTTSGAGFDSSHFHFSILHLLCVSIILFASYAQHVNTLTCQTLYYLLQLKIVFLWLLIYFFFRSCCFK